ncbi:hypothetical protein [Mucilaginibacter flavus]|uniref:hypothetical protein n=1 Tax=Mucilaginibacter flavus TaxID=931504 RepID=UPI0025B39C12|nr:hypothetical protein [Mucilaginibacter flavus]MDN3580409.1 hypothetical protein [Mucilaginibacter flavus]
MEDLDKQTKSVQSKSMLIAGINLALLAAYTIFLRINNQELIILGEAVLIAIQIIICLITAIFVYRKAFLLSALLVLLIGLSTCFAVFTI